MKFTITNLSHNWLMGGLASIISDFRAMFTAFQELLIEPAFQKIPILL